MNKLFAAVFAGLTAVAGYYTATNTGVGYSNFDARTIPASVRGGSARMGGSTFGGTRRGK
jgi:hypothetical protein